MILKISLLGLTAAHLPVAAPTVSLWNRSWIGVQEAKIKSTQKLGFKMGQVTGHWPRKFDRSTKMPNPFVRHLRWIKFWRGDFQNRGFVRDFSNQNPAQSCKSLKVMHFGRSWIDYFYHSKTIWANLKQLVSVVERNPLKVSECRERGISTLRVRLWKIQNPMWKTSGLCVRATRCISQSLFWGGESAAGQRFAVCNGKHLLWNTPDQYW